MKKWYFPYGYDIEKESVNNARIETFKDNILESLARETCQNSIDAALDNDKPVKMIFEEKKLDSKDLIEVNSFLENAIPKARETWKNDKKSQEFLDYYEKVLKEDNIKIMRIGDYNTTGLESDNWESLIENAGVSVKDDISSAGSFGIGKAAPFASSDLRMVFYNTKTISGVKKSIGVTKFISFNNEDGSIAQGVGYLGSKDKNPFKKQISFGFEKRTKPGTDLYIIGFNQKEKWEDKIIESLLENFLVTIYKDMLHIRVGNIDINKHTMGKIINNYSERRHRKLKNYYSVLQKLEEGTAEKILLDERFEEFGLKPEDGVLVISKSDDANRSVLMTRKAGMKIKDRKNISGSIQFNGIFQAKGDKFNQILKDMENPNHNDWIPERDNKNFKMSENLLRTMYQFMKSNVIECFQEKIEDQVDAFGMSDFLPNKITNKESNDELKKTGLDSKVVDIEIKKKNKKRMNKNIADGEDIQKKLEKAGIIDGDMGGLIAPLGTDIKHKGGEGREIPGDCEGDYNFDEDKSGTLMEKEGKFIEIKNITYRIIDKDYGKGKYFINIRLNNNVKRLKVEFNYIGENGSSGKIDLEKVIFKGKRLSHYENYFIIENLKGNQNYIINFQIPYNNRIKVEAKFYEYK